MARGKVRPDLFHRINVLNIRIPPLRERREDVTQLFAHFLSRAVERFGGQASVTSEATLRHLLEHDWPGNVRELAHYAERVALGFEFEGAGKSTPAHLQTLRDKVDRYEASLIREVLAAHEGDVSAAVEVLGLPRKTFYDKVKRYAIQLDEFRNGGQAEPSHGGAARPFRGYQRRKVG